MNRLHGPVFMAGPKPMLTKIAIRYRLESCAQPKLASFYGSMYCINEREQCPSRRGSFVCLPGKSNDILQNKKQTEKKSSWWAHLGRPQRPVLAYQRHPHHRFRRQDRQVVDRPGSQIRQVICNQQCGCQMREILSR